MITKKRKIEFTDESIQELMQETYHEIVDERNRALAAYKKFSKDLDEKTDIAMIGKITNDLLKIVDGSIDKKLKLIKLQAEVLYKFEKGNSNQNGEVIRGAIKISDDDRKMIQDMVRKQSSDDTENVKIYE